jgi:chromosomal replication initiation ATPase DnaA
MGDKCGEECFEKFSAPNKIYLQYVHPLKGTWSEERIKDTDIEYVRVPERELTIYDIMEIVCGYYNISPRSLKSKSHKAVVSQPRKIYCMLCRDFTDATLETIGKSVNRTSAIVTNTRKNWSNRKIKKLHGLSKDYDRLFQIIKEKMEARKLKDIYG